MAASGAGPVRRTPLTSHRHTSRGTDRVRVDVIGGRYPTHMARRVHATGFVIQQSSCPPTTRHASTATEIELVPIAIHVPAGMRPVAAMTQLNDASRLISNRPGIGTAATNVRCSEATQGIDYYKTHCSSVATTWPLGCGPVRGTRGYDPRVPTISHNPEGLFPPYRSYSHVARPGSSGERSH
jgi:hypothetical protein